MRRPVFCPIAPPTVLSLFITLLAVAPIAAHAQSVRVPPAPGYATNPPAADSPLQQQMLRNYRSDLLQTQRELVVQNPSGLSREQLDVMHQLNTVNSAPAATMTPATPLSVPGSVPLAAPFR